MAHKAELMKEVGCKSFGRKMIQKDATAKYAKMKELGLVVGGGGGAPVAPLDPPMPCVFPVWKS